MVHRFTREVVQKRRALINQQKETETQPTRTKTTQRKKDFVDIILLSTVEPKKKYDKHNKCSIMSEKQKANMQFALL